MNQPSIARMVAAVGGRARGAAGDVAPAVVTAVWGEHPDGYWTINATLFPDGGVPQPVSSIRLYPDEQAARAAIRPHGAQATATVAFWPVAAWLNTPFSVPAQA